MVLVVPEGVDVLKSTLSGRVSMVMSFIMVMLIRDLTTV